MKRFSDDATGFLPNPADPLRYGGQTADPRESPGILLNYIPVDSTVLDVGCGTGAISSLIRDHRRAHIVGIEPSKERAEAAARGGLEVINDIFSPETVAHLGRFDVVVFADVLEHLADPAAALRLARTLLNPGGCVATSVPNVAHWSVRLDLLRGRFDYRESGIMDATHLRWFTSTTLVALFESAGYHVEQIAGSAGLWMPEYRVRRPFKWLRHTARARLITGAVRRWPALFACQYVLKAVPRP